MSDWTMQIRRNEAIRIIALCLILAGTYFPTLSGEFILDDIPFVKNNPDIRTFQSPLSYLSQEDGILGSRVGRHHSNYYRPLVNLTYTLDYKIWGMSAPGFRLTNLLLHIATCVVLYACLRSVIGGGLGPFLGALLFGLHPANTETVSWVTARNNILVTLFCLGAFYAYVRGASVDKSRYGLFSCLFFCLALLSKEFAVMFPPVLVLYDRLLAPVRRPLKQALWGYAAFLLLTVCYLALRSAALDRMAPDYHTGVHLWRALYFTPFLIMFNLRIAFFPFGLHNFMVSYPEDWLGPDALLGMAGLALLAGLLWRFRRNGVVLFSSLSFLLILFPVLNIVPTSAFSLISMRWLYFPMAFAGFLAAAMINGYLKSVHRPVFGLSLVGVAMLYLGAYSYVLNRNLWRTEEGFFSSEVLGFKNYFYAGDLARLYHTGGKGPAADEYYQIALRHRSANSAGLLVNYAALLVESGRSQAALSYLERAEASDLPGRTRGLLLNNRGAAYFRLGDMDRAVACLEKAVLFWPENASFWMNLGGMYRSAGVYEKAVSAFRKALKIMPNSVQTKGKLGMSYVDAGDIEQGIALLNALPQEIRQRDPAIRRYLEKRTRPPK